MLFIYLLAAAFILAQAEGFIALYCYCAVEDMLRDKLNPNDACKKLNFLVPFDIGCHLAIMLLVSPHWYLLLWNLPVLLYNLNECYKSWTAGDSVCNLYDPTRILWNDQPSRVHRIFNGKMIFYWTSVLIYLVLIIARGYMIVVYKE